MSKPRLAAAVAALTLAAPVATASAHPNDFPEDRSFLVNAAQSNLAEIATGRLALRESSNAAVRAYAPTPPRRRRSCGCI